MAASLMKTKDLRGLKAVDSVRAKPIGKVHHFIFHPTERRCVGFTVKRPDAALMFHRKDLFVALDGYHREDDKVVVHGEAEATDKGAVKRLGLDWDSCVIWVGMPLVTQSGTRLGYVDDVTFAAEDGTVSSVTVDAGMANNALLGRVVIPASYIKGFRKAGVGGASMVSDESSSDEGEQGAILVSDEAHGLLSEGGVAAAAGKATAVATHKTKRGVAKVKRVAADRAERAKPTVKEAAARTGEAVDAGAFVVGRQLGRASGMFAAFKEEFDKASKGE